MSSAQGSVARFLAFVAVLGIAAAGGCAGPGLPLDEISEAPIALVYWDAATARRRHRRGGPPRRWRHGLGGALVLPGRADGRQLCGSGVAVAQPNEDPGA